ncbi:MAG: phosphoenolpyruvate hydrolase family protein [Planctomycetes bacterium]|nr:phosphoenolpyruvate hydrolase family protein [Planctomycetota bacterium]
MPAPTLSALFPDARRRRARVIGVVPGSGECARAAVDAGADLMIALNSGMFRTMGLGSVAAYMPYADANEQTERLLGEHILPHARACTLVAGVFGDASEPDVADYLRRLTSRGVRAVAYWPSVGQLEGPVRSALEADGCGLEREIETLRRARAMGFETCAFAFAPDEARRLAASGVDCLVLSLGLTRAIADVDDKRDQVQRAIQSLNAMHASALQGRADVPCLAYGGPLTSPEDLELLFRQSALDGFAGGSVFERLPLLDITGATVRRFKSVAAMRGDGRSGLGDMIGRSPPMLELFKLLQRVAPFDVSVCVEGETGTGKELVATQLHRLSHRAHQPFVTLNCGALPETLLESELFGHEKGAFTGAERRRLGKFELAHRGTMFLDEVASLSPHGQVSLLRALQQREIMRIGGEAMIPVDVRVIAASNENLPDLVARGRFRADLYHRLNQITLDVPPLRERGADLRLLAEEFLGRFEIQLDRPLSGLSDRFWTKLTAHSWPGNIRELQHVLMHAALREDGPLLEGRHFAPATRGASPLPGAAVTAGRSGEAWRSAIARALKDARGNKSRAAAALGVTRRTLYKWLEEIGS